MNLKGNTVRIIVIEPFDWEKNLFGTILSDRNGDKLLIKLTKPINNGKYNSDLLELRPRNAKTTFSSLEQYYSVTVNGALVNPNTEELDFIIIGTVTID